MSGFDKAQERDMVLFVGNYLDFQRDCLPDLSKMLRKKITACVVIDPAQKDEFTTIAKDPTATMLNCDTSSRLDLERTLKPYKHRLLAVTCRAERNIPMLKSVIPHVPYLNTPTESSLDWTTDKIKMRHLLRTYDKDLAPKFLVVHDATQETLNKIEKTIRFPLIIKPSGLAKSFLVTLCYHREDLESNLKNTVRKINQIHKKSRGRGEPQILVEEFMEGSMYSIDSYVNQRGTVYHAPMVHVRTGRAAGYDDFFGYMQLTPVKLKPHRVEKARKIAEKAIEALNLRSATCHIELMRMEDGWKVIEVGARIGGFRHELYSLAYGVDHSLNDILIRIPRKPIIQKRVKGYAAAMKFYAKHKGRLENLEGVKKARKLESFQRIELNKKIGDMCDFARNGDDSVFDIILFNKERSRLLADVRRLEQAVKIKVKQASKKST